ncbi:MAG: TetR/AcrR family transcriptional regulator C-terminal domain-containing protein [Rhizobiaceae bacterium]
MNLVMTAEAGRRVDDGEFTPRQREVLAVVLDLMVEEGDGFSMAKVCRRASCSKETLYNWFGDRDGLLTATVQWQASKVKMPGMTAEGLTAARFRDGLKAFAVSWLDVITSDVSAALNRLAISHAGSGKSRLGSIVLEHGPLAMRRRLHPIFEAGRQAGLIQFSQADGAIRSFFGLVVADWQIRKLLGDTIRPSAKGTEEAAERAVTQFLYLHGAGELKPSNTARE